MNWESIKTYLALLLVSLLYGINYSVLKIVIPEYLGAYGFIVFRVLISTVIFWLIHLFFKEKIDWKEDGWRLVLCGLTGVSINQLLFFKGISLTSAVNGSIIMTLTPIIVLVWAAILTKEKITSLKITGILIGMVGAWIIVYNSDGKGGNMIGNLLVFINGSSYACYLVLVKPMMTKYKPMTVVTWVFTFGLVAVIPVGFTEALAIFPIDFPIKVWWSSAYSILGVTVLLYGLNAWTLSRVNPSVVGTFIYLQPLFATLTAVFFFEEVFLSKHILAMAFVFTGVWLVSRSESKPVQKP